MNHYLVNGRYYKAASVSEALAKATTGRTLHIPRGHTNSEYIELDVCRIIPERAATITKQRKRNARIR